MAKKYQKAKGGASSLTVKIVAIVLMLVMICAIVFSVLQFCMPSGRGIKPSEWFGGTTTEQPKDPDEDREDLIADENGGLAISQDKKPNGAARLSATKIAEEDYEENGVSPQAETAVTISIIDIEPANATELLADWSATFLTEGNEEYAAWAEGKEVADYVTVTPAENTLSAVVECTAPFAAQIEVQAQFRTGDKVTLSCICDYYKDYQTADCFELILTQDGKEVTEIKVNDEKYYSIQPKLISVGTKEPHGVVFINLSYSSITLELANEGNLLNSSKLGKVSLSATHAFFNESKLNGLLTDGLSIDQLKTHCKNVDSYMLSHFNKPIEDIKHVKLSVTALDICYTNSNPTKLEIGELSKKYRLNFDYVIDVSNANFDKTQVDFNKVV